MHFTKRHYLETCLWSLTVVIPTFFLIIFRRFGFNFFVVAYTTPPFLFLLFLASRKRLDKTFKYKFGSLMGATIGAIIAVLIPNVALWDDIAHNRTAGVNIGLGFLFLLMPAYLIFLMLLGWFLGNGFEKLQSDAERKKSLITLFLGSIFGFCLWIFFSFLTNKSNSWNTHYFLVSFAGGIIGSICTPKYITTYFIAVLLGQLISLTIFYNYWGGPRIIIIFIGSILMLTGIFIASIIKKWYRTK